MASAFPAAADGRSARRRRRQQVSGPSGRVRHTQGRTRHRVCLISRCPCGERNWTGCFEQRRHNSSSARRPQSLPGARPAPRPRRRWDRRCCHQAGRRPIPTGHEVVDEGPRSRHGVTGTVQHPRTLLLIRFDDAGVLRYAGGTHPIRPEHRRDLTPAVRGLPFSGPSPATPGRPRHRWWGPQGSPSGSRCRRFPRHLLGDS